MHLPCVGLRLSLPRFATALTFTLLGACAGDSDANSADDDAGPALEDGGSAQDSGNGGSECTITWREDGSAVRVSMTDDGREVNVVRASGTEHHTFDERGLWVGTAFSGGSARAPLELEYDERGHLISATAFGEPGNSCTNAYDAQDRIMTRTCSLDTHGYTYDAEGRIDQVTITPSGGTSLVNTLGYDGTEEPTSVENDTSLYTYDFDAEGRRLHSERDWTFGSGKDGTFDIRWTWSRRADGSVRTYSQDGTDHNDAPVIDGVADLMWSFSEACSPITLEHPWLTGEDVIIDVGQPMPAFPF